MSMVRHQRHQRREPHVEGVTTVLVDPDGDLILRIGAALQSEHTTDFRVCSSTLRRCSPVFEAMLSGGIWAEYWKPSPSVGLEWTVSLPHDSPRDMQVLLNITHTHFDTIPSSPSTGVLYRIIVLADKYALAPKLSPWVSRWLKVMRDRSEAGGIKTEERVLMMRIAWHLGDEKLYLLQLKDFILRACFIPAPDLSETRLGGDKRDGREKVHELERTEKETGPEDLNNKQQEARVDEWLLRTFDDNCDLGHMLTAPGEIDCGMPDLLEFIDTTRYESLRALCVGFTSTPSADPGPESGKAIARSPLRQIRMEISPG